MKANRVTTTEAIKFVKDLFKAQKIVRKSKKVVKPVEESLIRISDKFTPEEYNYIVGYDTTLKERVKFPFDQHLRQRDVALEQSNWGLIDAATKEYGHPFIVEKTHEGNAIMNFGSNTMYVDFWHLTPEEMNGRVKLLMKSPFIKK